MQQFEIFRSSLIERRDAITSAIDALDIAARLGAFGSLAAPAEPIGGKKERALKGNKQTNKQTKHEPRQRAARSLPDDEEVGAQESGRRQKVLALLKDGPLATRDVARTLKIDKKLIKVALKRMKGVGLVTTVGIRAGSKWALPGSKPAKEAP